MTNTLKTMAVSAKGLSCSMGSISRGTMTRVALLLLSSLSLLLPMVAGQAGFINIDCGSTSNYTDPDTRLVWTTDDGYISTGSNQNVNTDPNVISTTTVNLQQLSTARYFQQSRKKHCYGLPVEYNSSYLIRASFLYGDLEASLPSNYAFKLSIDSTIVETVRIASSYINTALYFEFLVASTSQQIVFCIIPVVGNAFISSLELKPLLPDMYWGQMFNSKYIKLLYAINCNQKGTEPTVRYPDDKYDRLWTSVGSGNVGSINTTKQVVVDVPGNLNRPPMIVMQTAWTGTSIWFDWGDAFQYETTSEIYFALYFAEIGTPKATDVRSIDLSINDDLAFSEFTVSTDAGEISTSGDPPFTIDRKTEKIKLAFNLTANANSTLPPLLNGAELHAIYKTNTSTTAKAEVLYELRENLNLFDWTGDPCLPVSWDWLNCSSTDPPTVTQLKLSGYQLRGTIPESIADLTYLTDLWLDNNNLTGLIPNLAALTHLKTLHLQNNSLTGSIPASLADISYLSELFLTDNNLDGPVPAGLYKIGLDLRVDNFTPKATPKKKSGNSGAVIGAVIGVIVVVILLAVLVVFLWCRRRTKKRKTQPHVGITGNQTVGGVGSHHVQMTRAFSKAEVQYATENFGRKIGEGGFGPVYYGKLTTGQEVAVKVNSASSGQGWDEFSNEVNLLSRVHHRNLVSLVGFCDEGDEKILIYEYMQYGTLREHLYGRGLTEVVDWQTRLDIALGAAQGLEYLHYGCSPKIIHRDVKSNNILLNEKLLAKVADFGISKLTLDDAPTRGFTTIVRGTNGYLDPECLSTNKITQKSDVYAFGVVLLEIITGRSPNDNALANTLQLNLVQYARGLLRDGNLEQIVDPALSGSYNIEAMWKLAELAMYCVEPVGQSRPDMRQVVRDLIEAVNLENLQDFRLMTPKESPGPGGASALLAQYKTPSSTFSHVPTSDSSEWTKPGPR